MNHRDKFVVFREKEQIVDLIDQVTRDKGIDRSDFIREAVRRRLADLSFFSDEAKKALGTQPSNTDERTRNHSSTVTEYSDEARTNQTQKGP